MNYSIKNASFVQSIIENPSSGGKPFCCSKATATVYTKKHEARGVARLTLQQQFSEELKFLLFDSDTLGLLPMINLNKTVCFTFENIQTLRSLATKLFVDKTHGEI